MAEFIKTPYSSSTVRSMLNPIVDKWFFSKFKDFSLPQLYAVKEIQESNNILVSAPTGTGKTLTAFLSILNQLIDLSQKGKLGERVYCIYISPLKALNHDISINLTEPLEELNKLAGKDLGIKVAVRTGDTSTTERSKMLHKPPHILITTPESIALILSSPKFKELVKNIKWVIVDELHALAENKRGVHLSLSLERLQKENDFVRIGLSATISPIEEIAKFLVGYEQGKERKCKIVDISLIKQMDLKVICPAPDIINTTHEEVHTKLYETIHDLVQQHKTTLIFTNTRSSTERVVHYLKEKFPKHYTENIGAHHGSLSKEHRFDIENRLRKGELKCIVSSTSLELGIDIGYIDLVICLSSPKSIARLAQRCLPYNSNILLKDGSYRKIGEIVENKLDVEILSYDSKKGFIKNKIEKYHKNKEKRLFKINLHSGSEIKCSAEHPFMTRNGWKKASELNISEEVAEIFNFNKDNAPYIYEIINQKKAYVENKNNFLRTIVDSYVKNKKISYSTFAGYIGIKQNHLQNYLRRKGRKKGIRLDLFLKIINICKIDKTIYLPFLKELKSKSHHRLPLPLKLDRDIMWLAGIVASDGSITKHKKTKELKIKIGNKDLKLLEECQKIYKKFGFNPQILKTKNKDFWNLDCGSTILAELLISLGLKTKNKTKEIEVSNLLYNMPKELIIPFIEGFLEGDGNINRSKIRIFTASKKFANGLHNLLNRCGIYNYFNRKTAKTSKLIKKINHKYIYCVYIGRNKHVKNFLKYCTIKCKKAVKLTKLNMKIFQKEDDIDENTCWVKINSIRSINHRSYVYNLTLKKNPNNYFVESVLTHNCGRAGHKLHETIKGRVLIMDRDDLVECAVMLKHTLEKNIDKIHIPTNCLDVLAQQVLGIIISGQIHIDELFTLVKRSYCYNNLERKDFQDVIDYLAGKYALEARHIYARIWHDEETGFLGKKGKLTRVIYSTNIGTIPETGFVTVKIKESIIGYIDEAFLERLKPRDIFVLGGQVYEFLFSRGLVAQVKPSISRPPTVPSWFSETLPLSFDLSINISKFRRLMLEHINKDKDEVIKFIKEYLYLDNAIAEPIYNYFKEQFLFSEIPHDKLITVELFNEGKKKYFVFHTLFGRRVNDCLSRAIAFVISKLHHKDVEIGINDNGFYLSSEEKIQVIQAFKMLKTNEFKRILELAIEKSEIYKRRFRHCATRSLMILRNYKGKTKYIGRQQVSSVILMSALNSISHDFFILKEARREVLEDLMDIESTLKIIKEIELGNIKVKQVPTSMPSPFAFNIVLQGRLDVMKIQDRIEFLKNMHNMVLAKIDKPI